jgi:hypothetical protein
MSRYRSLARQLLPGVVLPGLIYFAVSRRAPVLIALAAASSVPVLDAIAHLVRGRRPTPVGLVFVGATGLSVGLAAWLHSPTLILLKSALVSTAIGMAFAVSAAMRRPLTRTLAVMFMSAHHIEGPHGLRERWHHPKALSIFRVLAIGWAVLLLATAAYQTVMALTLSPGLVVALDGPVHAILIILGTIASIMYVRPHQRSHPELGLLPGRVAS